MSDKIFEMMKDLAFAEQALARGEDRGELRDVRARVIIGDTAEQQVSDVIRIEIERYGVNYHDAAAITEEIIVKLNRQGLL